MGKRSVMLLVVLATALLLAACSAENPVTGTSTEKSTIPTGQPMAIPHSIDGKSDCLTCHGPGEVGSAVKTDHPELKNCRQCHVLENPQLSKVEWGDAR
ncbi:MAG: hypothetical protein H0Z35_10025 [Thermoanaerobacteraceae bacterium]|nr:hypothetical protein [Thermoanaerobacteraceae bacterium]